MSRPLRKSTCLTRMHRKRAASMQPLQNRARKTEQGTTKPRPFEIGLAEAFIDAGADGVFGHHQHLLQPLGWYEGKPIAWGLGNLVWQAHPAEARKTAMAQFVFEPDGRIGACLVPVVIEDTGHPVHQPGYESPCAPAAE